MPLANSEFGNVWQVQQQPEPISSTIYPPSNSSQIESPSRTHIPRLLNARSWAGNNAVDYALIFDFCNGGDLGQLIDCYGRRGRIIPEDFI
jgi:serine/threonine protein kinase